MTSHKGLCLIPINFGKLQNIIIHNLIIIIILESGRIPQNSRGNSRYARLTNEQRTSYNERVGERRRISNSVAKPRHGHDSCSPTIRKRQIVDWLLRAQLDAYESERHKYTKKNLE